MCSQRGRCSSGAPPSVARRRMPRMPPMPSPAISLDGRAAACRALCDHQWEAGERVGPACSRASLHLLERGPRSLSRERCSRAPPQGPAQAEPRLRDRDPIASSRCYANSVQTRHCLPASAPRRANSRWCTPAWTGCIDRTEMFLPHAVPRETDSPRIHLVHRRTLLPMLQLVLHCAPSACTGHVQSAT